MVDLSKDIAIVTGASSGLGWRFAQTLARAGASVVCAARRTDRLGDLVSGIAADGGQAHALTFDAEDASAPEALIAATEDAFGQPTILINNAGINIPGRAHQLSSEAFDQTMAVNLKTPWRLSQLCATRWITHATQSGEDAGGRIVNVASILGRRVQPGVSIYSISKAAMLHMTASHAREWVRYGIRVNALCPGYFKTEINDQFWDTKEGQAELARLPRRRIGDPAQLDPALLFLVNPANDFTNGEALAVDDAQGWAL